MMTELSKLAHKQSEHIIALRREIHQNPELGFEEFHTTDIIAKELEALGIPYRRLEPTGIVAQIEGAGNGGTVALRADIDALPIQEETTFSFKSKKSGVMHACGHDTHAAMLLGAASILQQIKESLNGTVRLIFQPAEEIAKGAREVIAQGGLEGVDRIFAIHIGVGRPVGTVLSLKGPTFASSDRFRITVRGKKCHGAFPHTGVDPVLAGSAIVMALQSFTAREFDALEPLVVTVGSFVSDGSHNVISGSAVLEGTIRTYSREIHEQVEGAFRRLVENTAAAFRCETEIDYRCLTDVLINDDTLVELGRKAAEKLVGAEMIEDGNCYMGSEDFSEYTAVVPGAFFTVCAGGNYPSHHGKFEICEEALEIGAALYAQFAVDSLQLSCL